MSSRSSPMPAQPDDGEAEVVEADTLPPDGDVQSPGLVEDRERCLVPGFVNDDEPIPDGVLAPEVTDHAVQECREPVATLEQSLKETVGELFHEAGGGPSYGGAAASSSDPPAQHVAPEAPEPPLMPAPTAAHVEPSTSPATVGEETFPDGWCMTNRGYIIDGHGKQRGRLTGPWKGSSMACVCYQGHGKCSVAFAQRKLRRADLIDWIRDGALYPTTKEATAAEKNEAGKQHTARLKQRLRG